MMTQRSGRTVLPQAVADADFLLWHPGLVDDALTLGLLLVAQDSRFSLGVQSECLNLPDLARAAA